MAENQVKLELPYYAKMALVLLLLFLLVYIIYLGQGIILPLAFSFLFAILLRPVEIFLERCRVPRVGAILLTLFFAILFLYGLIDFISVQIASFMSDMPAIERNMDRLWDEIKEWANKTFGLGKRQQEQMLQNAKSSTIDELSSEGTFNLITASVATLTLIPIYVFLFMYYRMLLLQVVVDLFPKTYCERVWDCIKEIKSVIQHFVTGVMIETSIVAAANSVTLLFLGAPYAIMLGLLGALLNMIPYIGGIVQLIFSALVIYSNTMSLSLMIWASVVLLVIQFVDNNFLMPYIIGTKVELNSLISIIGVLAGGALCGIGGMFLAIPFLAICKVIFDRVDDLKPWGRLFGTNEGYKRSYLQLLKRKKPLPPLSPEKSG